MQWFLFLIFATTVAHANTKYASECLSINQQPGLCMPIKSCKIIYDLFTRIAQSREAVSEQNRRRLASLHCGTFNGDPHVCCPQTEIQLNVEGLDILKNVTTCGAYTQNSVAHGKKARLFQFPWMAVLIYDDDGEVFGCGGSLITDRYVLTAAHCISNKEKYLTKVRLGEYQMSTAVDCMDLTIKIVCSPPAEDFGIEQMIMHDNYAGIYNDIALIRLNRKVEFKRHIKPICLPIYQDLQTKVYEKYVVSGWGKTEKGNTSDILMARFVPWMDRIPCEQELRKYKLNSTFNEGHICAGGTDLGDTCLGDSGGPLGHNGIYNGSPRFIQFGVISKGINKCGVIDVPGVYTNISYHLQWITDNIKEKSVTT